MINFVKISRIAAAAGVAAAFSLASFPAVAENAGADESAAKVSNLAAVVVGVSDIESAFDFYTSVLGLELVREVNTDKYLERILAAPGGQGTRIVLFQSFAEDIPAQTRIVFYSDDAAGIVGNMEARDLEIVHAPAQIPGTPAIVGIAKDADGTLLEFIQLPKAPVSAGE